VPVLQYRSHPPMSTCGKPETIVPPWAVRSPNRAAGMNPMSTVTEPFTMMSGGPTQTAMSVTRAAGMNPINTFGWPLMIGPPTCGIGGTKGVTIGQTCMSVIRAASMVLIL
jgi:hypothetical protein